MMPFQLLCVAGVWGLHTRHSRWLAAVLAIWPMSVFYWEYRFDLAAAGLLALGLLLAYRGRWGWSGAALGAGTLAKWSPGLSFLFLAVWLVAGRRWTELRRLSASFVVVLLVHVPLLFWDAGNVVNPYTAQGRRAITNESVWYFPQGSSGSPARVRAPSGSRPGLLRQPMSSSSSSRPRSWRYWRGPGLRACIESAWRRRCRPCAGDLPADESRIQSAIHARRGGRGSLCLRAHGSEPRGAAPRRAPRNGGHICECIRLSVRERPFQPVVDARVGHGLPAHASGRARRASEHAHGENGSRGQHLVRRANSGLRLPRRRSRYLQPQRRGRLRATHRPAVVPSVFGPATAVVTGVFLGAAAFVSVVLPFRLLGLVGIRLMAQIDRRGPRMVPQVAQRLRLESARRLCARGPRLAVHR